MKLSIVIYEFVRFIAILISQSGYSVQTLPLSWYAAVPLAFLPVILSYLALNDKTMQGEVNINTLFIYIVSKILMIPGFIVYLAKTRGQHSIQYILGIVLFLLIDVMLIIIFTIIIKKNQNNNQKPDETP